MDMNDMKVALVAAEKSVADALSAIESAENDEALSVAGESFTSAEAEVGRVKGNIALLERAAKAKADATVAAPVVTGAIARGSLKSEPTFRLDQATGGYFHTLALARGGDPKAFEKLVANNKEVQERAGITTGATAGGEFVPPDWTVELYAAKLRVGRAFADQCINMGAPVSSVWSIPRITTGASEAVQTEGAAASNTDQVTDSVSAAVQTVAGRTLASYQLMDLSEPGMDQIIYSDLLGDLNAKYDNALLNGTVTNAKGVLQLAGTTTVTYTDATPTGPELYAPIFQGKSAIEKGTFLGVDFIVMHTSTWNWYLSQLDTANRPLALSVSGAAFNAMAQFNPNAQGVAGNIAGIPVVVDANVPVNLGAGTNQAQILLANRSGLLVKEGTPVFKVADQTSVASLQYNFVLYNYYQAQFGRHPLKFAKIDGTGLIVQAGF